MTEYRFVRIADGALYTHRAGEERKPVVTVARISVGVRRKLVDIPLTRNDLYAIIGEAVRMLSLTEESRP